MNVSAASLAPDSSVRKATPSDITERTARSGAVVETIFCQDHGVRSVNTEVYRVGVQDLYRRRYTAVPIDVTLLLWTMQIYGLESNL